MLSRDCSAFVQSAHQYLLSFRTVAEQESTARRGVAGSSQLQPLHRARPGVLASRGGGAAIPGGNLPAAACREESAPAPQRMLTAGVVVGLVKPRVGAAAHHAHVLAVGACIGYIRVTTSKEPRGRPTPSGDTAGRRASQRQMQAHSPQWMNGGSPGCWPRRRCRKLHQRRWGRCPRRTQRCARHSHCY